MPECATAGCRRVVSSLCLSDWILAAVSRESSTSRIRLRRERVSDTNARRAASSESEMWRKRARSRSTMDTVSASVSSCAWVSARDLRSSARGAEGSVSGRGARRAAAAGAPLSRGPNSTLLAVLVF